MQSVKNAVVFAGGSVENPILIKELLPSVSLIICADSGVNHCENMGISAHIIVGDFDSADLECVRNMNCAENAEIIVLNPVKDDTDTEFSICKAMELGAKRIYLVGGLGTRLDHSLANIFLMEKCWKSGVELIILNEKNTIHYLANSSITLQKDRKKYYSVLPLEESVVSNKGFGYPLNKEILYRDSSRGVSNELVEDYGSITVHNGAVLVIESVD